MKVNKIISWEENKKNLKHFSSIFINSVVLMPGSGRIRIPNTDPD